jgi:4-hydroxybenzoate polyprenyltransferase
MSVSTDSIERVSPRGLEETSVEPLLGQPRPLCVDLDGTLVKGDLLYESALLLLKKNPLYFFLLVLWLFRGKAYLKRQIAGRVAVDVEVLPYNKEFLDFLKEQHRRGRIIILATSADRVIAERVARHLGLFAEVIASDGLCNLTGPGKARVLRATFGDQGFDYAGNELADLGVWQHSGEAIVVNATARLAAKAGTACPVGAVFPRSPHTLSNLARAVRAHQWAKNLLVLVPLITSHSLGSVAIGFGALLAFIATSLCASSVYVLNDLLDIEADRHHPKKRSRPFAAGDLSVPFGLGLTACLLAGAVAVSFTLPRGFGLLLGLYYGLTLAYSLYFKKKLLLDVFFLAGLYTIRILAGAAATRIACSAWLLAFSMFVFFSLALVKRFSELRDLRKARRRIAKGRSYRAGDAGAISSLGMASGLMSVLVLALYINSPQVQPLYPTASALWLLCPLFMYWISRIWMIADRGKINCDPVLFTLKDKVSYLVGLLVLVVILIASSHWSFVI